MSPAAGPPLVWRRELAVRVVDVGPDERLRPTALIDLFQEEAGHQARAFGLETFALPARGGGAPGLGTWVLSRLAVEVSRWPAALEPLALSTWPSHYDGLRASRDFALHDAAGVRVARATSAWFVLDLARRRPTRLPPEVLRFGPPPDQPRALAWGAAPEAPRTRETSSTFAVRWADLDRVGHANNARYAEWALEAVPDGLRETHALAALDVLFQREAVAGDTVASERGPAEPSGDAVAFAHRIAREDAPLALARSVWRERS